MSKNLNSFARNTYSQFGEDGILGEILDRLSTKINLNSWCVEFGAWDGVYLSNTCALIRERGYRAVLIEGDQSRVAQLETNHPQPSVIKINRMVEFSGENSLDAILETTEIPEDFDLLSIDIDGCDYWILDSLKKYKPKVLIVEFNPTIPNEVEFIQEADFSVKQGCRPKSLHKLAASRGYTLVAATTTNLIFVDNIYADVVLPGVQNFSLDNFRDDADWKCFIFSGYDGTLYTSTPIYMPWHDVRPTAEHLQVIPNKFRTFPDDMTLRKSKAWARFKKNFSK